MSYDLSGEKFILSINVIKYNGINRDRNGTEVDEEDIIKTLKERILNSKNYSEDSSWSDAKPKSFILWNSLSRENEGDAGPPEHDEASLHMYRL